MKTLIFLITIISATSLVRSGEIIPVWQTVWDIDSTSSYQRSLGQQFLKGHDQFMTILIDSDIGSIQIRETLSGDILDSVRITNVYEENKFEVLPDSNRFIMSVGGVRNIPAGFEIRNIDDYSIINKFEVPLDGESTNENGNPYNNRIIEIKTDPLRPYVYFILEKGINGKQSETDKDYYAIKVYNYQTGEEINELRTYKHDYMKFIDISYDGKYLASLNEGESYLNVWDLESLKLIRSYELDKDNSDNSWRENVRDLKFSKLNSDIIYFSGSFSRIGNPQEFENGVFEYSIERGNHINKLPDNGYSGKLIFAEDEKILLVNLNFRFLFFNFLTGNLELFISHADNHRIVSNAIYTPKHKCFVSSDNAWLYSTQYLTITSIDNGNQHMNLLSPNPTTGEININLNNRNPSNFNYELISISGQIVKSSTIGFVNVNNPEVVIDISEVANGQYTLRIYSEREEFIFNLIKEG